MAHRYHKRLSGYEEGVTVPDVLLRRTLLLLKRGGGLQMKRPAPPRRLAQSLGAECPALGPQPRSDPLWELALYKTRLLRVTALRV